MRPKCTSDSSTNDLLKSNKCCSNNHNHSHSHNSHNSHNNRNSLICLKLTKDIRNNARSGVRSVEAVDILPRNVGTEIQVCQCIVDEAEVVHGVVVEAEAVVVEDME